jgi:two-component system chemotaxis response regulator CheB
VVPSAPEPKKFALRSQMVKLAPDAVAIGSSTGGPQALMQFFTDLRMPLRQPVFVTQHMPPTFTTILAEHISKQSGLKCREAQDGEEARGGIVYIAPGNFHMIVKADGAHKRIFLTQDPPENFCRPAVDPMLRSIVAAYGRKVLTVILTGMGSDGMRGCQKVVEVGGTVLAQDEATSVVWGMPGAAAMAGLCTQVLPLGLMAQAVRDYADRPGGA